MTVEAEWSVSVVVMSFFGHITQVSFFLGRALTRYNYVHQQSLISGQTLP